MSQSPFAGALVSPANAVGTTPRADPVKAVSGVASEPIAAGSIVHVTTLGAGAVVRNANAAVTNRPARGYVLSPVSPGGQATVYLPGSVITGMVGLQSGADYYLGSTPGSITTTPGPNSQYIGTATGVTTLAFNPGNFNVASNVPVGTITSISVGAGLAGGGSSGAVAIALALTQALIESALGYVPAPIGSLGIVSTSESASFTTQSAFNTYFVDTSGGAITVTLNPTPKVNEVAEIWDATGYAGTNPISFNGNGHNIGGGATVAAFIQIGYGSARLIFAGTQWLVR